ncbi:alpha/beta hydrolase [Streptomyces zagrosensis]|uniref:Pimeloyl-ACP methyl ester carboxylesterase n=1 Tax=Streptomyces zagrosensis TaxID=1042984 RepID=A0A7W9QBN9_9ACTN|nr:alpha/beta hydrolase [Streptomyces zagrosensis]MBB5936808.1 pimeloyl-ACP methyl ester carboxylesterase [Streptomyces zagrosensis]
MSREIRADAKQRDPSRTGAAARRTGAQRTAAGQPAAKQPTAGRPATGYAGGVRGVPGVRTGAWLAAVLLIGGAAVGCGSSDDEDHGGRPDASAQQELDWSSCPAPDTSEDGADGGPPGEPWECATLHAPLDYARPEGKTIGIALIRARATDQDRRIGSLIYNFGGPGGSGITALPAFAENYQDLRERYDLVSFDPRGVGRSNGVRCLDDRDLDAYHAADATPDNARESTALDARIRTYAAGCKKHSGTVLPHIGTVNAARDLDLMRRVLGDSKLHYFGVSYGTELGGVYAHLYPDRVGRALFDAVVDPDQDPLRGAIGQARGFQRALQSYLRDCPAERDDCPTEGEITAFLKRLDNDPLPGKGGRSLTQSLASGGIAQALYSKDFWEYLTQGLSDAEAGDGQVLLALGDAMNGRSEDGHYSSLQSSLTAITCADFTQRYTPADIRAALPTFRKASPVFGDYLAWGLLQCAHWPTHGTWQTPDVSARGAAPILVVGNTGDPATPYEGARRMARALGRGVGVELTYHGEGHGAYDSGDPCVKRAVDAYLLAGKVPRDGTVCR